MAAIFAMENRADPGKLIDYYSQMGVYQIFRQTRANGMQNYLIANKKDGELERICAALPAGGARALEYGAGVAPMSFRLARACGERVSHADVIDVPAEHLYYGAWRVRARLLQAHAAQGSDSHYKTPRLETATVRAHETNVRVETPPTGAGPWNVIFCTAVFEVGRGHVAVLGASTVGRPTHL